jgi:hypothetical protein
MKKNNLILIISLGLIFFGCEDDNNIKTSEIKIGDNSNMIINYYDTTLIGEYNVPKYFNIDLDNDGNDDIQFESELWGSPAVGQNPKSVIKSLSESIQFYGFHRNDTSFLNRDTSVYTGANDMVEIYYRYNYTCHQIDKNDSILKITPSFKLTPLDRGAVLKMGDTYKSDTITLINDWYGFPPSYYEINSDTAIIEYRTYYNDCDEFPLDNIKYIGVRFYNDSRLGWIKVSVFDKYKILIIESGIQE